MKRTIQQAKMDHHSRFQMLICTSKNTCLGSESDFCHVSLALCGAPRKGQGRQGCGPREVGGEQHTTPR